MLYRIIKKNQNKIFWTIGQFEFEYFGGSDVVNKNIIFELLLQKIFLPIVQPQRWWVDGLEK